MQYIFRKNLCSLDRIIWIDSRKFLLLLGKYFSSGDNVLGNCLEKKTVFLRNKFSDWNISRVMNKDDKTTNVQITAVFGTL